VAGPHSPFLKAQAGTWRQTWATYFTDEGSTVLNRITITCLTLAGVIHLLPLPGILGAGQLTRLYGVSANGPNVGILLQHRAVLFGLLGALLIAAAFRPDLRAVALIAGLVSTASFLAIAWGVGGYNAQVARVVAADALAVILLLVAAGIEWRKSALA
jgi:hypothetical protein